MKSLDRKKQINHTSLISIAGNLFLCFAKLISGIFGNSAALVSDAIHSGADAVDTIIVLIGVKMAAKKDTKRYPYGRERMECVAAIILSVVLCFIGGSIGYAAITSIVSQNYETMAVPQKFTLIIAVLSIIIKEILYWYMKKVALRTHSDSLMAIAWHNHADALCSVGSFIGILGSQMGYPIMDPLVSTLLCLLIIKAALTVFKGAIDKMTDRSKGPDFVAEMQETAAHVNSKLHVDNIRTRMFGNRTYVEIKISLPSDFTFKESVRIADEVKHSVERSDPSIKECIVVLV